MFVTFYSEGVDVYNVIRRDLTCLGLSGMHCTRSLQTPRRDRNVTMHALKNERRRGGQQCELEPALVGFDHGAEVVLVGGDLDGFDPAGEEHVAVFVREDGVPALRCLGLVVRHGDVGGAVDDVVNGVLVGDGLDLTVFWVDEGEFVGGFEPGVPFGEGSAFDFDVGLVHDHFFPGDGHFCHAI